ncbi:uncharacterized protein PGRI_058460 [Penicillium griseofulvum]|uniref:Uncharacterized protein n=1 Tax=Penicillium patulum TaxID=5078 RepID=A0A135LLP3_PENPA|nr:uncharacterized protein PGRI_058460 [Penicillium griseofulvum]KXG49878.1 hypothetical protein PGRI_058460 [Penicillium griseofulvum]
MPASFFSLPAELRNEIYMYLLVRRRPIIDLWYGYRGLTPSLLSTNTKILQEARTLLYGDHGWILNVIVPTENWVSDYVFPNQSYSYENCDDEDYYYDDYGYGVYRELRR